MKFRTRPDWPGGRAFILTFTKKEYRLYVWRTKPEYAKWPFEIQVREVTDSPEVFLVGPLTIPERKRL